MQRSLLSVTRFLDTTAAGIRVSGSAIKIELLKGIGGAPIGSTIIANPVSAAFGLIDPLTVAPVSGFAHGTKIAASVLGAANVYSGPTALTVVPPGGTGGRTIVNAAAAVDIPGVVSLRAVESNSMATSVPVTGDVLNTNNIGRVNVLERPGHRYGGQGVGPRDHGRGTDRQGRQLSGGRPAVGARSLWNIKDSTTVGSGDFPRRWARCLRSPLTT